MSNEKEKVTIGSVLLKTGHFFTGGEIRRGLAFGLEIFVNEKKVERFNQDASEFGIVEDLRLVSGPGIRPIRFSIDLRKKKNPYSK